MFIGSVCLSIFDFGIRGNRKFVDRGLGRTRSCPSVLSGNISIHISNDQQTAKGIRYCLQPGHPLGYSRVDPESEATPWTMLIKRLFQHLHITSTDNATSDVLVFSVASPVQIYCWSIDDTDMRLTFSANLTEHKGPKHQVQDLLPDFPEHHSTQGTGGACHQQTQ